MWREVYPVGPADFTKLLTEKGHPMMALLICRFTGNLIIKVKLLKSIYSIREGAEASDPMERRNNDSG